MLVSIHKPVVTLLALLLGVPAAFSQVWSLQQCIDTAQVHNRTLQADRNQLEISRQKQLEAEAGWYPKLNAGADYKYFLELPYQLMPMSVFGGEEGKFREAQFGVPHNLNANLQVSMPLYQPRLNDAIRSARIGKEISNLQYRKSTEQLVLELTGLYYNAQVVSSQLAFVVNNLSNSKKLLANMQLLKEQLLATGTDVSKVSLQVEQLVTRQAQLQVQYQQLLNTMKFTMGVPLELPLEVDTLVSPPATDTYPLHNSTDLELSRARGRLLSNELSSLQNSFKPSLSLNGSYGLVAMGYDKSPNAFINLYPTGFAALQLTIPIFNGTVTKKRIRQKSLELQNNTLQQNLQAEKTQLQVTNATQAKAVAGQAIETTRSQTRLAQSIYEQTLLQQRQGLATLTEVLLADNALQDAQQKHLSAMIDFLRADLDIKTATGNLINN